jgi:hypothetical protein
MTDIRQSGPSPENVTGGMKRIYDSVLEGEIFNLNAVRHQKFEIPLRYSSRPTLRPFSLEELDLFVSPTQGETYKPDVLKYLADMFVATCLVREEVGRVQWRNDSTTRVNISERPPRLVFGALELVEKVGFDVKTGTGTDVTLRDEDSDNFSLSRRAYLLGGNVPVTQTTRVLIHPSAELANASFDGAKPSMLWLDARNRQRKLDEISRQV